MNPQAWTLEHILARKGALTQLGLLAFLTSLAMLNAQVTVTRLLAYQFFYHFVFFVISLAQLGLAGAGSWIYASRRSSWEPRELANWLLAMSAMPLVILVAYSWFAPEPNLSFAKVSGPTAYVYLLCLAWLLVLFNLCAGMVLTMIFTSFKEQMGRLYASDLAGAALGCLISVGMMWQAGPIRAFLLSAFAGMIAFWLVARLYTIRLSIPQLAGAAGLLLLLLGCFWQPGIFDPNNQHHALKSKIKRSDWNHVARVDATGPSRYVIDGDASTDLFNPEGITPLFPEYTLVKAKPRVGIVGVGAGPQLKSALDHDARSVLAIDINPAILKWDLGADRGINHDLFHDPRVTAVLGEGRHTIRSSTQSFDLLMMYAIDTWTASSQGAYSLSENFLYTTEAIQDFHSRLSPQGVMGIRRWYFQPPRETMRLFTTVYQALSQTGPEPEKRILALLPAPDPKDPDLVTWGYLFFSPTPFSPERLAQLDSFVKSNGWSYLYRPGGKTDTEFQRFIDSPSKQAFYQQADYLLSPAYDENPFFFQFSPPWASWGRHQQHFQVLYGDSTRLLFLCFITCFVLAGLMLGIPLFRQRRELAGQAGWQSVLIYFGCLGMGFMAFELVVIQNMTLFLGHPIYALSLVLMSLLIFAGCGSFVMEKLSLNRIPPVLMLISLICLLSALFLLPLLHQGMALPDGLRIFITLAYVAACGTLLGMPFVAGIRLFTVDRPAFVALAWSANGLASVLGSCLIMMVMVYLSSRWALVLGMACYLTALATLLVYQRRQVQRLAH